MFFCNSSLASSKNNLINQHFHRKRKKKKWLFLLDRHLLKQHPAFHLDPLHKINQRRLSLSALHLSTPRPQPSSKDKGRGPPPPPPHLPSISEGLQQHLPPHSEAHPPHLLSSATTRRFLGRQSRHPLPTATKTSLSPPKASP